MERNSHIFIGKPRGSDRVLYEFIYFFMHTSESLPLWNNNRICPQKVIAGVQKIIYQSFPKTNCQAMHVTLEKCTTTCYIL